MNITQWTAWLVEQCLPRWSASGVDLTSGGFFEGIDARGQPLELPRRTRVVARQIYVFSAAARRHWLPGAQALVEHGLHFLLNRMRMPQGHFAASVLPHGEVHDGAFDLYEQAFVLFALAEASRCLPERRAALRGEAEALLGCLRRHWAHPVAGFEEAVPQSLPLKSNPHMHLLEAALAWVGVSNGPEAARWQKLADELAELCLAQFIDADSGALREYFDGRWQPMPGAPGRVVEPGHQFEWAWLLMRWAGAAQQSRVAPVAQRLRFIAETQGVDPVRQVAVDALDAFGNAFTVTAATARLWPQTERIKAWHLAACHAADAQQAAAAERSLSDALVGLSRYLQGAPPGLWQENMMADGSFDAQPAKASSLYHIVCAIDAVQGAGAAT